MQSDPFFFSLPQRPEGSPVTAADAERMLRARIAECPESSPERSQALWQLARFLSMTGRHAEALLELDALLAATDDLEGRAEIVLGIGQVMEQIGDYAGAIEVYTRGVSLEPVVGRTWYLLHNNLGYSLNRLGRHAEAERWCRAAIEICPERHNARKNLGIACAALGKHAEAARCFIDAVKAEAADPRALGHLEELLAAHPEVAGEVDGLEQALERCRAAVALARSVRSGMQPPPAGPSRS